MEKGEVLKMRELLINYEKEKKKIRKDCVTTKEQADSNCRAAILKEMGVDEKHAKEMGATITSLQGLQRDWSNYIDNVHYRFEENVDKHKKKLSERISSDYKSLCDAANQSTLTKNGQVVYTHESPIAYALKHPFSCDSKILPVFRSIVVVLAVLWALVVVIRAIHDTDYGLSISQFFSSSTIYVGLYVSVIYILVELLWTFLANKKMIDDKNAQRKANAESKNADILDNIAQAKAKLKKFEETFGKYFKTADGKWNFAPEKMPIDRETAEDLLQEAQKYYTCPKLPIGINKYKFEINYQSL